MSWIELILSLRCNCRCSICPGALRPDGAGMDRRAIFEHLARARAEGASGAWFGGGEPSLHPTLIPAMERARKLGYSRIRLQTNGLRLAYPRFAERCLQAGLDQVGLSVKGAGAATHDRLTRVPGGFELLCRAVGHLVALGVEVEAEVLVTRDNLDELPECVETFGALGVERFAFWLVSLHGLPAAAVTHLPGLPELRPHLEAALDRAGAAGYRAISLHTPPCALGAAHRSAYQHSGTWDLTVVLPDGRSFPAEQSPMEGGEYPDDLCGLCRARPDCLGLRADYLEIHGTRGLEPV